MRFEPVMLVRELAHRDAVGNPQRTNMTIHHVVCILLFVLALSACDSPMSSAARSGALIDQNNICEVKGWQRDLTAAACKPGQKVAFLPDSFGNEQLPVLFAAVNCDLRYSVALTNGGVTCIYFPLTPAPPKS